MKTNQWFLVTMLAASFAVAGCFAMPPASGGVDCTGAMDDSIACTVDVCPAAGGAYRHIADDAACASGQMCSATAGCVMRDPGCPASCSDGIACTVDRCESGVCQHGANDDECPDGATCRASSADGASGCYTPPMESCSGGCSDGVSCTVDSCVSGSCRHFVDDTECGADQRCSPTAGCVDDTDPPPTGDFECILSGGSTRIGYLVRVCARGMTGVRTVPDRDGVSRPMTNSALRLWALGPTGGAIDAPTGGCVDYNLGGRTGGINTHPYINQWRVGTTNPEYERDILNVADLRPFHGRPAADIGLEAYVCQDPSGCDSDADWTVLPDEFYTVARDTTAGASGTYYCDGGTTSSVLHSSLCGQVPERAVLYVSCTADHHVAR